MFYKLERTLDENRRLKAENIRLREENRTLKAEKAELLQNRRKPLFHDTPSETGS